MRKITLAILIALCPLILSCIAFEKGKSPKALITYSVIGREVEIHGAKTNLSPKEERFFLQLFKEGFEDMGGRVIHWIDTEKEELGTLAYKFGVSEASAILISEEQPNDDGFYTSDLSNPKIPSPAPSTPKSGFGPVDPFEGTYHNQSR